MAEVGPLTTGPSISTIDESMIMDQLPRTPQVLLGSAVATSHPERNRRLPAHYRDKVPQLAPPAVVSDPELEHTPRLPRVILIVWDGLKTLLGSFGLWRNYAHRPTYDPDSIVPDSDLARPLSDYASVLQSPAHPEAPWPYQNLSTYRFMTWLNTGSKLKSEGEVQRLVDEVLHAEDFNLSDLCGLNV